MNSYQASCRKSAICASLIILLVIGLHGCSLPSGIGASSKQETPSAQPRKPSPTVPAQSIPPKATPGRAGKTPVMIDPASAYLAASSTQAQAAPGSPPGFGVINDFDWLADGSGVALAGAGGIAYQSLPSPQMRAQGTVSQPGAVMPVETPSFLTSALKQQVIAWVSGAKTVYVWRSPQDTMGQVANEGLSPVTGLALSPAGDQVVFSSSDRNVTVKTVADQQKIQNWKMPTWLSHVSYSPKGPQIGAADLKNFTVYILDIPSGKTLSTLEWIGSPSQALYGVYFSPDWSMIAWVAQVAVQIMDVESGKPGALLNHEDFVSAVAWSPDGRWLASASAGTVEGKFRPLVTIWDVLSGERLYVLPQEAAAQSLSFSPDGKSVAILDSNGNLKVWDMNR